MLPDSIFYKPRSRDENALTYAFLALLEKISQESLLCLSDALSLEPLKGLEFSAVFQPILSNDKIPDGLLVSVPAAGARTGLSTPTWIGVTALVALVGALCSRLTGAGDFFQLD